MPRPAQPVSTTSQAPDPAPAAHLGQGHPRVRAAPPISAASLARPPHWGFEPGLNEQPRRRRRWPGTRSTAPTPNRVRTLPPAGRASSWRWPSSTGPPRDRCPPSNRRRGRGADCRPGRRHRPRLYDGAWVEATGLAVTSGNVKDWLLIRRSISTGRYGFDRAHAPHPGAAENAGVGSRSTLEDRRVPSPAGRN